MEKSDGSFFAPGDFVVGDNVSFYGRTFHIVDADVFTRQTMADAGLEYGPPETYPDDPFTTKKLSSQRHGFGQSSLSSPYITRGVKDLVFFEYMESVFSP